MCSQEKEERDQIVKVANFHGVNTPNFKLPTVFSPNSENPCTSNRCPSTISWSDPASAHKAGEWWAEDFGRNTEGGNSVRTPGEGLKQV